jgi:hypothetical protein
MAEDLRFPGLVAKFVLTELLVEQEDQSRKSSHAGVAVLAFGIGKVAARRAAAIAPTEDPYINIALVEPLLAD